MARGVNKVILVGNLGNDPETRYMPSGGAVCELSVATTRSWKDKQSGEQREETEWHKVVGYQRLGEIMGQYLRKGSQVFIEGRIRTEKWQDKEGKDRFTTKIIANDMQMLGGKGGGGGTASFDGGGSTGNSGGSSRPPQQQAPASNNAPASDGGFDDDIPF